MVRARLGDYRDRFLSSVFDGSGLVVLAMVFASIAIAGGILSTATAAAGDPRTDTPSSGSAAP